MRNGIIGRRRGLPVVQMPVVSSLTISASLAGGLPPILGAIRGQLLTAPSAGDQPTGEPCSQRLRSRLPLLSRGVWHSPHMATPSTRYLPRATSPPPSAVPLAAGDLRAWAYAGIATGPQINGKERVPKSARTGVKMFIRFISQ